MELQSKYQQADSRNQLLEQTETHLRTKLAQKETALEVSFCLRGLSACFSSQLFSKGYERTLQGLLILHSARLP